MVTSCAVVDAESARDQAERPLGELLDQVVGFVRRFVVLSIEQADAVALWVVHTHAFEAAETTPYLSITSAEKASGKTRLLEVLELLVARPWFTGRVTAAVLTRKIAAEQPTLLLDESDSAFKGEHDYAEALRGILNTGYRYGGRTSVSVREGNDWGFRDFSTFCAKAIAGIGELPDTVASRSIPIRLKRRAPDEPVERFRHRSASAAAAPLQERLAAVTANVVDKLAQALPKVPEALSDRAADVWEPLLAIADLAGGCWPERARRAATRLSAGAEGEDDSHGIRLLADIRSIFDEQAAQRLPSAELAAALAVIEDAPWAEWKGKPLTPAALASLLKRYRIGPKMLRIGDKTARGYERAAFEDAFRRYLPPAACNSRNTISTTPPETDPQGATTRRSLHPVGGRDSGTHADVSAVAPSAQGHGERSLCASSTRREAA